VIALLIYFLVSNFRFRQQLVRWRTTMVDRIAESTPHRGTGDDALAAANDSESLDHPIIDMDTSSSSTIARTRDRDYV